jgi:adenylate kinase
MVVYHEQTRPLLDYYQGQAKLVRVDGVGAMDEITERIHGALA